MADKNPDRIIENVIKPKKDISQYLNPRTRKVYNLQKSIWEDKPTKWNKMLKLPSDDEELMGLSRYDLEDIYDVNQIKIDLGDGWGINDDYDYGFQVVRNGEPFKQFKKGGLLNETEVINFEKLKDAIDFYNKQRR